MYDNAMSLILFQESDHPSVGHSVIFKTHHLSTLEANSYFIAFLFKKIFY